MYGLPTSGAVQIHKDKFVPIKLSLWYNFQVPHVGDIFLIGYGAAPSEEA